MKKRIVSFAASLLLGLAAFVGSAMTAQAAPELKAAPAPEKAVAPKAMCFFWDC